METIGKRLSAIRKNFGLTIVDVAEKTGIARSNLSRIENDKHDPSAGTIKALARFYGVSADWILFGEEKLKDGIYEEPGIYRVPEISDRKLKMFFRLIAKIWLEGDKNMRGWIIVQLSRAFPDIANLIEGENKVNPHRRF